MQESELDWAIAAAAAAAADEAASLAVRFYIFEDTTAQSYTLPQQPQLPRQLRPRPRPQSDTESLMPHQAPADPQQQTPRPQPQPKWPVDNSHDWQSVFLYNQNVGFSKASAWHAQARS